jgi:hypothetical protein
MSTDEPSCALTTLVLGERCEEYPIIVEYLHDAPFIEPVRSSVFPLLIIIYYDWEKSFDWKRGGEWNQRGTRVIHCPAMPQFLQPVLRVAELAHIVVVHLLLMRGKIGALSRIHATTCRRRASI